MSYAINIEPDFIRAELAGRQTAEQTKNFLRAIAIFGLTHTAFLIRVCDSAPMVATDPCGLIEYLITAGCGPAHRIALVTDAGVARASRAVIDRIARRHSLNLRVFCSEVDARQWLRPGPALAS